MGDDWNGASSFHLFWRLPGPVTELAVTLEILTPPAVPSLYFWALQADFDGGGGAHAGLQWHPFEDVDKAVNWGGYGQDGTQLDGSALQFPPVHDNPNTAAFEWETGREYRLRVFRVPGGWRATIDDRPIRDLYHPALTLTGAVVWSEVFADCADPTTAIRWSDLAARTVDGNLVEIESVTVNYQAPDNHGCSNTDSFLDGVGVIQKTGVPRTMPQGAVLSLPSASGGNPMSLGVDYAWNRPRPSSVAAAGYKFVCRYLSNDPAKNLSPTEALGLRAANLDIVVVWESTANRALGGSAAGTTDGRSAKQQAESCGLPSTAAIYYAVDFDARPDQFPAILAYQQAFDAAIAPHPVGVYGGVAVVSSMTGHGARYGWQTAAWSRGQRTPAAALYQRVTQVTIDGAVCDVNEAVSSDYGGWAHPSDPPAAPTPGPSTGDDDVTPIDTRTGPLDSKGNGYLDEPGVDPQKVINVVFNVGAVTPQGYPATPPRWGRRQEGGVARIVFFGGSPGANFDCTVWVTG